MFGEGRGMSSHDRASALYREAGQPGTQTRQRLIQALSDLDPLVRHIAAIELARLWPNELPEAAIRELLETFARLEYLEHPEIEGQYATATVTPDEYSDLGNEIIAAFTNLGCGQADFVIPRLLEFWSFDLQQYDLGHALIALAFPVTDCPVPVESLSGVQRRVLEVTIRHDDIWRGDPFWPQTLAARGLPTSQAALGQLLGAAAGAPNQVLQQTGGA
jgi:hypothetical protein